MEIRCFCPPDNLTPLSPISVSHLSGKASINSVRLALFAASYISSSVAFGLPYLMLSLIVPPNKNTSC